MFRHLSSLEGRHFNDFRRMEQQVDVYQFVAGVDQIGVTGPSKNLLTIDGERPTK
jgi:hypothetical protein